MTSHGIEHTARGNVASGDESVDVLTSYGPFRGFTLHSLADAAILECALCGQSQQLTLVATRNSTLACPWCFAQNMTHHYKTSSAEAPADAQKRTARRYCVITTPKSRMRLIQQPRS